MILAGRGAKMAEGLSVKPRTSITWTDVGGREAALIQRAPPRDEDACAELVSEHQRMVYQLSLNLLGDHNEALDLSQEVFLRVFRTIQHVPRRSRRFAPGSTGSSSIRRATGSAGGGGGTARSRSRSTSTSATTASCRSRATAASPDRLLGAESSWPSGSASRSNGCRSTRGRRWCCARSTA